LQKILSPMLRERESSAIIAVSATSLQAEAMKRSIGSRDEEDCVPSRGNGAAD
jgi:hypothetical protein